MIERIVWLFDSGHRYPLHCVADIVNGGVQPAGKQVRLHVVHESKEFRPELKDGSVSSDSRCGISKSAKWCHPAPSITGRCICMADQHWRSCRDAVSSRQQLSRTPTRPTRSSASDGQYTNGNHRSRSNDSVPGTYRIQFGPRPAPTSHSVRPLPRLVLRGMQGQGRVFRNSEHSGLLPFLDWSFNEYPSQIGPVDYVKSFHSTASTGVDSLRIQALKLWFAVSWRSGPPTFRAGEIVGLLPCSMRHPIALHSSPRCVSSCVTTRYDQHNQIGW